MNTLVRKTALITRCKNNQYLHRCVSTLPETVVSDELPVVVQRAAMKTAKEALKMEQSKVSKSTFSQRISPFLWGFVLASIGGVYLLNKDLDESNVQLHKAILAVKHDKQMELAELEQRIERLEDANK